MSGKRLAGAEGAGDSSSGGDMDGTLLVICDNFELSATPRDRLNRNGVSSGHMVRASRAGSGMGSGSASRWLPVAPTSTEARTGEPMPVLYLVVPAAIAVFA